MKKLVIFGTGSIARLAACYFNARSAYSLCAFCVDDSYYDNGDRRGTLMGRPIIPASALVDSCPPDTHEAFVGIGYQDLNSARQRICQRLIGLGYSLASCVSPDARIFDKEAHGWNCFIMEGAVLQPFSRLGNNCICWSNSVVAHESIVEDNCFLSAGCVVGGMAHIGHNTFLGINSSIRNNITIGKDCVIGAGCVILNDLKDGSLTSLRSATIARVGAREALRFIDF